jgi:hypothetical protein
MKLEQLYCLEQDHVSEKGRNKFNFDIKPFLKEDIKRNLKESQNSYLQRMGELVTKKIRNKNKIRILF